MPEKDKGLLYQARKKAKVKPKDLDAFINAKGSSTKYFIEDNFENNKLFKYLLFLKLKGISLDAFFKNYIKLNKIKINKNE